MIRLDSGDNSHRNNPLSRREMMSVGALSLGGLAVPQLLGAQAGTSKAEPLQAGSAKSFGKAKNCIILFLSGGPPQHDTFDPKPDAPAEIRGEFDTIPTAIPGLRFTEYLPKTASLMNRVALVRSMTHTSSGHANGGYIMFTGYKYPRGAGSANFMSRTDMPFIGSCVAKVAPGNGPMYPTVLVPGRLDAGSKRRAGQWGGLLGGKYDPLLTGGNPNDDDFRLRQLPLAANRPEKILRRRKSLIDQLNAQIGFLQENPLGRSISANQEKAIDVLSSEKVRRAVDLASADPNERARYGRNLFGQCVLLGRRLVEAGTRLVQINWQRTQGKKGYAWDSHSENFVAMREDLIPPFDVAYHALITDLEERGLLDETLVVVAGEFGRSPKITPVNRGREHWPQVFSVLFAGAGIKGGAVYGASDKTGGYPADAPVSPAEYTATIFHCLGIDPQTEVHDELGRPLLLSTGKPVEGILI